MTQRSVLRTGPQNRAYGPRVIHGPNLRNPRTTPVAWSEGNKYIPRDNRVAPSDDPLDRVGLFEKMDKVFGLTGGSSGRSTGAVIMAAASIPAAMLGLVSTARASELTSTEAMPPLDLNDALTTDGSTTRVAFATRHGDHEIDLNRLARSPEALKILSDAGLNVSDLMTARSDGVSFGALDAFKVADHLDHNGDANSLILRSSDGTVTPAGKALLALDKLLAREDLQPPPNSHLSFNDRLLYVGMNNPTLRSAAAPHEVKELRKTGANMIAITDSKLGQDKIRVGSTTYDLSTEEGREGFVGTLGLSSGTAAKVADALAGSDGEARDELAAIAQIWAKAEKGGDAPSRMILSGHHVGSAVYGDGNGRLTWTSLEALAKALPKGAAYVEDLNTSACYTGGDSKEAMLRSIFPNLKTLWTYSHTSPGAGSGATVHQAAWERATRGRTADVSSAVNSLKSRNVRYAENIYNSGNAEAMDLAVLRTAVSSRAHVFDSYFTGAEVVTNSQTGPLREYYSHIQHLLSSPSISASERGELEARRDQTIRLLYYSSNIAGHFAETHGAAMQTAFTQAGLTAPNFATASRVELKTALDALQASGVHTPEIDSAISLLEAYYNLSSDVIPEVWV